MSTAIITNGGKITIPVDVRRRLALHAGDRVEFVEIDGGFAIKPVTADVRALKGLLRKSANAVSLRDMNLAVRARASRI